MSWYSELSRWSCPGYYSLWHEATWVLYIVHFLITWKETLTENKIHPCSPRSTLGPEFNSQISFLQIFFLHSLHCNSKMYNNAGSSTIIPSIEMPVALERRECEQKWASRCRIQHQLTKVDETHYRLLHGYARNYASVIINIIIY